MKPSNKKSPPRVIAGGVDSFSGDDPFSSEQLRRRPQSPIKSVLPGHALVSEATPSAASRQQVAGGRQGSGAGSQPFGGNDPHIGAAGVGNRTSSGAANQPGGGLVNNSTSRPPPSEAAAAQPQREGDLDELSRLLVSAYAVASAERYGQSVEMAGPAQVLRLFQGDVSSRGAAHTSEEVKWFLGSNLADYRALAFKAFRYALKIALDRAVLLEDEADMELVELEESLRELDEDWHLGPAGDPEWRKAMEARKTNLASLKQGKHASEYSMLKLLLKPDTVRVGELRSEVAQSIWAATGAELRYVTNDDEERFSIQAHPTLLRNMIIQSAEYPIFVSPPTLLPLVC